MVQFDLLKHLCMHLDRMGIHYFITGSQAATAFGEPRFTNDIDVVVDPRAKRFVTASRPQNSTLIAKRLGGKSFAAACSTSFTRQAD